MSNLRKDHVTLSNLKVKGHSALLGGEGGGRGGWGRGGSWAESRLVQLPGTLSSMGTGE